MATFVLIDDSESGRVIWEMGALRCRRRTATNYWSYGTVAAQGNGAGHESCARGGLRLET